MSKYANLRYVGIYRTSNDTQTEKSIPDQKMICTGYAEKHNMIPACGDLEQCGISSTKRKKRDDIDELIDRKREFDDFDVILVHDYSRLTRRGTLDAFAIEAKLNEAGIQVLSATEEIPDGPYADVIKTVLHTQHHAYVRESSNRVVRGQMSSILQGRSVGSLHTPYGIDRLYISRDGTPRHHIRTLPDGSRVRINVKTGEVISTYERHEYGHGKCQFYKKQMDEMVTLVPGDPEALDNVRRIFRMAIIDGKGYWLIAKALNDDGIPSPRGGQWDKSSVRRVMCCPVYTGRMIFNRTSEAEFFQRSKTGPMPVPEQVLKMKNAPRVRHRPPEDWAVVDLPATKDILDPDLKELVIEYQDILHRKDAATRGKGLRRDKHSKSSFILKDVLRLKHDGSVMHGVVANQCQHGRIYRYYKPRRYSAMIYSKTIYACLLPAEPIESLVIDLLSKVFAAAPDLKPQIIEFVKEQQAARHEVKTRLGELERQRTNLNKKIACFADIVGDFDDVVVQKVADMRARLRDLDIRIGFAKQQAPDGDAETIAESVIAGLRQMNGALGAASPMTLRKMLTVLVSKLECDPKTREVWLEMALPAWAVNKVGQIGVNKFCLGSRCSPSTAPEAKKELLFAKVHMMCLRTAPKTRAPRKLESYNYSIVDGLLADEKTHVPAKMPLPGHIAGVVGDCLTAAAAAPQRKEVIIGGYSAFTLVLPVPKAASKDSECGPYPLGLTYWTPSAIPA